MGNVQWAKDQTKHGFKIAYCLLLIAYWFGGM